MGAVYSDRKFQLWNYSVSHGSLLIRSPKSLNVSNNIDLICLGVEYLSIPRHIDGLELVAATNEEVVLLSSLLQKDLNANTVRVVASYGRRFPIVAASFEISEHDRDIFELP